MPEPRDGVVTLLLAGGLGSRYRQEDDRDKLLVPSAGAGSRPVLQASIETLQGLTERLVVVARADNRPLCEQLEIWRRSWAFDVLAVDTRGLGHSLAQGVAACPAARGWLVALGDMPYVRRDTLATLVAQIEPERLLLPVHDGQPGHPRGIGARHRSALLALDGDRGAQALFTESPVLRLPVRDAGVLRDIDRPGDRMDRASGQADG
ncbi:nucleotidyltransferase family protein [Stutzerimonas urumqiensis]|uniref:nucleotidyltransferase family protein n=1 Tax=Stutzerimonas urumqiensis TaxID=638269 RepID=UPI003DA54A3A